MPIDVSGPTGRRVSPLVRYSPSLVAHCAALGAVLSNGFLIILTVIFILAEAASFYPKLRAVLVNPDRDLAHFGRITGTMNRYIAIKTSVSRPYWHLGHLVLMDPRTWTSRCFGDLVALLY